MSFFSKLRGITETAFQIGLGRPQLKSLVTGELEIRDSADTGYAVLRVGTPVGADDATTLTALQNRALLAKSGTVAAGTFAGSPKKATITFSVAFADANYSIVATPVTTGVGFSAHVESQLAGSFVLNLGSNSTTGLTQVNWVAVKHGESS